MIPRLDLGNSPRTTFDEWPDETSPSGYLYAGRKPYRKLVVMVDSELLDCPLDTANLTKSAILTELLNHDLVRLYRYADDGPPPGTPSESGQFHAPCFPGWAVIHDHDPIHQTWGVAYESSPTSYSSGGVMGNAVEIAGNDTAAHFYLELSVGDRADKRRADALAVQVARQALQADIYITERPYIERIINMARGVTVCGVDEALALVGHYLRIQDDYLIARQYRFNRGLFFWVGTRALLTEAWRWFTACVQNSSGSGDDSMIVLGGSLLQRVQRALEARDAIHLALNSPQNTDTQQEALSNLDVVLVFLMAAVDVAARVAHRALGLGSDEYRAAWQSTGSRGWLPMVRTSAPALAQVISPGTTGEHVLTILRLLRNSVHGPSLQGLAVVTPGNIQQSLVGLPPADQTDLLAAFAATGGQVAWGATSPIPGRWHLDPGVFCDRLFAEVVALLNDLMRETPVENLPHVNLSPPDSQPPAANPFLPWILSSIRWQLGF